MYIIYSIEQLKNKQLVIDFLFFFYFFKLEMLFLIINSTVINFTDYIRGEQKKKTLYGRVVTDSELKIAV